MVTTSRMRFLPCRDRVGPRARSASSTLPASRRSEVSPPTAVPGSFPGPYFIATIKNPSPVLPLVGAAPPPTKFYVVNDGRSNRTYEYGASGTAAENYALSSANTAPRGAVSTAAGDKVWVVDANRQVYVYDTSGGLLGSWTAGTLARNATVEGIATNGTDMWIVDARSDKVFKYVNAASLLSGSQNAASSFKLNRSNTSPKDIVTDGTHLWVVNDAAQDKVFKYTLSGSLAGSWTMTGGGGAPTGITLDPAAPSHLWIVDNKTDRVYQYDNAVGLTSGSLAASTSFALAADNTNPQGIADPPPPSSGAAKAVTQDAALLAVLGEMDWLTPAQVSTGDAGLAALGIRALRTADRPSADVGGVCLTSAPPGRRSPHAGTCPRRCAIGCRPAPSRS